MEGLGVGGILVVTLNEIICSDLFVPINRIFVVRIFLCHSFYLTGYVWG